MTLLNLHTTIQKHIVKRSEMVMELTKNRFEGLEPIIPFPFKFEPFPHQIEGFNYLLTHNNVLLADEQGLGKTFQSINVAVARKQRDGVYKCLIVCGVNSVKYNWKAEITKYSDESSVVFDGSEKQVLQAIDEWVSGTSYFGIINIEKLRNVKILTRLSTYISNGFIGMSIFDEIHKAKNHTSQQGKALQFLDTQYRIGLTGTPLMNNVLDLWNVLKWLKAEHRNYYAFRKKYCELGGFENKSVIGVKNGQELMKKLNTVMLRRKKDEVLNLPPKIYSTEYVVLDKKHRKIYEQIKQGLLDTIEEVALSPNPLASTIRLRQCTGGVLGDYNPKLVRLKEMLEEIVPSGAKVIIFSQWTKVTDAVYDELSKLYKVLRIDGNTKDRMKVVEQFQTSEKHQIIIGTIGAMGTGLTLNKAEYVIFMDKAWTSADNEQAEDRAHRIGTKSTVNVVTLVAKDTIDDKIELLLREKKSLIDSVVDGKKKNIAEILRNLLA